VTSTLKLENGRFFTNREVECQQIIVHRTHMSTRPALWTLVILFVISGCGVDSGPTGSSTNSATTPTQYDIVTTCGMVTDIVSVVSGDRGNVRGLMGEGVDPHLYKPTRNDQSMLLGADLVFFSGLKLEGRLEDTFASVKRTGKPVHAVTHKLGEPFLLQPPEFEGHFDPHVWMDITAWSQCVDVVADAMAAHDPEHADDYRRRADDYQLQLAEMDDYVRQSISTIPKKRRWLVTAHDAFGYFSRAYKIPTRSVQGISTDSEAAVDDINQLVSFITERKIAAIFVESSVNPKNITAIVEGCKQANWDVRIGGKLFSDAMGAPGSYTGTYLGMMDHNATTITRALGGTAPETGKHGKLKPQLETREAPESTIP